MHQRILGQYSLGLILALSLALPMQYIYKWQYSHTPSATTIPKRTSINNYEEDQSDEKLTLMKRLSRFIDSSVKSYQNLERWFDEVLPPLYQDEALFYDDEEFYEEEVDENGNPVGNENPFRVQVGNSMMNGSEGYFAMSNKPRRKRPKIGYRVGQVVKTDELINCAIIGWDPELRVPEEWAEEFYGDEIENYRKIPHFALICDLRETDLEEQEFQYLPKTFLHKTSGDQRILSYYLDQFFEFYDIRRHRYRPRMWLRKLYPKDL